MMSVDVQDFTCLSLDLCSLALSFFEKKKYLSRFCIWTGIKASQLETELKVHFRDYKQPAVPSALLSLFRSRACEPEVPGFLTAALQSSVVIVEGVTLWLIDKRGERKKPFFPPRLRFHLSVSRCTYSVITACRPSLWAHGACVCAVVCAHVCTPQWNALPVSVLLNWPHLSGLFRITALVEGEKNGFACVCARVREGFFFFLKRDSLYFYSFG